MNNCNFDIPFNRFQVRQLTIVFVWLLLNPAAYVFAQGNMYGDNEDKKFSGALILGLNFAQVDGDSYYGYHKVGLHAGGEVYIHFTPVYGLSMDLLYSQKGSRGVTETESPYVGTYFSKYYMDVNYVEVPVTFHYIFKKYDVEAGASYARLVKSNEWILTDQPVIIDPVRNRFNISDVDMIFGLTRQIYKKLFTNLRYQYSLTSIRPGERIP